MTNITELKAVVPTFSPSEEPMTKLKYIDSYETALRRQSANNLRYLRRSRHLTLEALSELTDISPSYLSRLEAGARRLNSDIIQRLSIVLGCQPGDLLNAKDPQTIQVRSAGQNLMVSSNRSPESSKKDLPIYSNQQTDFGLGGGNQPEIIDMTTATDWANRPTELENIKNAFALYITNDAAAPKYFPGDLIHVHPSRPIASGCSIVLVAKDDSIKICQFLGWRGEELLARSFKDPAAASIHFDPQTATIIRSKSELKAAYRIIGSVESH